MESRRATDLDRERAAEKLRESLVAGAVSNDTFEARLGLVLSAPDQAALQTLTHDLPSSQRDAEDRMMLRLGPDEKEVVLGRHRSCERVFDDDAVSRRHALVRRARDGLRLHDLDSTNGTWLHGERIEGSVPVSVGDRIKLGRVLLRLEA